MSAAIAAALSVVGKALAPMFNCLLEEWAASKGLGPNMEALKAKLEHAQRLLETARSRQLDSSSLNRLSDRLQDLAYDAEDVLDETDYFRIQDEVDGTCHAADVQPGGCVPNLAFNACNTANAIAGKLRCCGTSSRGQRAISSTTSNGGGGGMLTSARNTAYVVGKHFPCYSFPLANGHDADSNDEPRIVETPKLKFDRVNISKRMKEICEKLKLECDNVAAILSLEPQPPRFNNTNIQDIFANRHITNAEIIEPEFYGREKQKNSIVDAIKNDEYLAHELTVLPIVGYGGIGKTTFTQHVYQEVKGLFQVPIWVCVSRNFDINRLTHEIVKQIVKSPETYKDPQEQIKQQLKGRRFLFVLDDMWECHEEDWKRLLAPFRGGGTKGNVVMVTTRFPKVAKVVQIAVDGPIVELGRLGDEDFMCLFQACVFGDQVSWQKYPRLHDVGRDIVSKLKGSPLAAKTVGRLLKNYLTLEHWRTVLQSREWEQQENNNYDIMPALKLSYNFLPPEIRQCFYYCALFPEDHEFDLEQLIHFWIGLDILHLRDHNDRIEDAGRRYLNDLINYGFLKQNQTDYGRKYYVIHDLLHELATTVSSSYDCFSINSSIVRSMHDIPQSIRHLSIIVDNTVVEEKTNFEGFKNNLRALKERLDVRKLRTLILYGTYNGSFAKTFGDMFKEMRGLRTLILSEVSYTIDDIFYNFSNFVHLRYLRITSMYSEDLRYLRIISPEYRSEDLRLPCALVRLYHLSVIDLHEWHGSFGSTRHISNLVKLRHFLVPEYMLQLHSDIIKVEKLKFIQEVKKFKVGNEGKGFELRQLGQLIELGGSLDICNIENLQSKDEASESKLTQKDRLNKLTLEWDINRTNKDAMQEDGVLECLQPNSNLQELCIIGHGGINCPRWLGAELSVNNLESLRLHSVSWKDFPPLGGISLVNELGLECPQRSCVTTKILPNLKRLELVDIVGLERWVGTAASDLFSRLEILVILRCPALMELPFSHPASQAEQLPNVTWPSTLWELNIVDCPKLVSLPPIPWICCTRCRVKIEGVASDFEKLSCGQYDSEVYYLRIEGKGPSDVTFWKVLAFNNLSALESLTICNCPPLPLDLLRNLSSLRILREICVKDLTGIYCPIEGTGRVGCDESLVESIDIYSCGSSGRELTRMLSYFPKLSELSIDLCEGITGLGVAEQAHMPSVASTSGNKADQAQLGHRQQHEQDEIVASETEEGLLLLPPLLRELRISRCRNLLFSNTCSRYPFPTSLQILRLSGQEGMKTLEPLSNLTSLTELIIIHNSENLRGDGLWPLLAHGHLTKLIVHWIPNLFAGSQTKPSFSMALQELALYDIACFLQVPICSLFSSSLTKLEFNMDTKFVSFTREQEEALEHLASLQELCFSSCENMQVLPTALRRLPKLNNLRIFFGKSLQSLAKDGLPSSLQQLLIQGCPTMGSLPKDSLPSSLQELVIMECPTMLSLPEDGLPSSLLKLNVKRSESKELRRQCRKLIGTIPVVIC